MMENRLLVLGLGPAMLLAGLATVLYVGAEIFYCTAEMAVMPLS
jgi:hypothetical protein